MNCLKCGREIRMGQSFCADCLEEMEKFPVEPGTPIVLPRRENMTVEPAKSSRVRIKPDEIIRSLRTSRRFLWIAIAILSVLLGVTAFLLYWVLSHGQLPEPLHSFTNVSRETIHEGAALWLR